MDLHSETELDFEPTDLQSQLTMEKFLNTQGRIGEKELQKFHRRFGLKATSQLLQKVLKSSSDYRFFQQEMLIQSGEYSEDHLRTTIFLALHCPFVPKKLQRKIISEINLPLSKVGYEVHLIPFNYRGSVSENAHTLWQRLRNCIRDNVYIVSFSQGSLETRFLLEQMPDKTELQKLKGWLNISGMLYGSVDVPQWSWSPFEQYKKQTLRGSRFWTGQLKLPHEIPMVSYYGFSPDGGKRLAKDSSNIWGPTDGIVALADSLKTPGTVCPIVAPHHVDVPFKVAPRIVKTMQWIHGQNLVPGNSRWKMSGMDLD